MAREINPNKRILLANPDEPRTGDYAFGLYDKSHPVYGDPETINYLRKQLRGLRGENVVVRIKGARIDDDGEERRFTVRRSIKLNRYSDVFGPGSAYASAVHSVRDRHSDETLVTFSVEIEPSSEEYDDEF